MKVGAGVRVGGVVGGTGNEKRFLPLIPPAGGEGGLRERQVKYRDIPPPPLLSKPE